MKAMRTKKPLRLWRAAAVLACMLPLAAQAESKIGFVNPAEIMDEAPQAEAARKKLESEFAPREKEVLAMQKDLRTVEDKLARDGAVMSEAERSKLERDLLAKRRDIKNAQDEFREDLNIRRNEELGKLQRRVYEVIVELAKQEKFDLIVGDAIFASERTDITKQVLERLKKEAK